MLPLVGGRAVNGSIFGAGDVPIGMENINCNGTEESLTDCSTILSISNTISSCSSSTVAGTMCYGMFYYLRNLKCSITSIT